MTMNIVIKMTSSTTKIYYFTFSFIFSWYSFQHEFPECCLTAMIIWYSLKRS